MLDPQQVTLPNLSPLNFDYCTFKMIITVITIYNVIQYYFKMKLRAMQLSLDEMCF